MMRYVTTLANYRLKPSAGGAPPVKSGEGRAPAAA